MNNYSAAFPNLYSISEKLAIFHDLISVVLTYDILDQYFLEVSETLSVERNFLRDLHALSTIHCALHCWTNIQCEAILFNSQDVGSTNCQVYMESVFKAETIVIPNNFVYFIKSK